MLHALEQKNIFVSAGSACTSRKPEGNILAAIGLKDIGSAIRFSFSVYTTKEDLDYTIQVLEEEVNLLRRFISKGK